MFTGPGPESTYTIFNIYIELPCFIQDSRHVRNVKNKKHHKSNEGAIQDLLCFHDRYI